MIQLRTYQVEGIASLRRAFSLGRRRPIFVLPTGGGKSHVAAYIVKHSVAKGRRVWICVHRSTLMDQLADSLGKWGVEFGVIQGGVAEQPRHMAQVVSIDSVARRIEHLAKPDLILIDECHRAESTTYKRVTQTFSGAHVIGLTATPCRLDGKPLGDTFDDIIYGPSVAWLMNNGFLCKVRYYAPPQVADISSVRRSGSDYNRDDLCAAMEKPTITGDIVEHYSRICPGLPAVVFTVSIQHAKSVCEAFVSSGHAASIITGDMDKTTRRKILADLGSGRIKILVAVDLVSEGMDIGSIAVAILARPTFSVSMHLQQIGRVLRPAEGKDFAIVLDHVGNLRRHGLAEERREWSLDGKAAKKRASEPEERICQCKQCFAVYEPAPMCPQCGYNPPKKLRKLEEVRGELVIIAETMDGGILAECPRCKQPHKAGGSCSCGYDPKREKRREQGKARSFQDLVSLAKARGIRNPQFWAKKVLSGRK